MQTPFRPAPALRTFALSVALLPLGCASDSPMVTSGQRAPARATATGPSVADALARLDAEQAAYHQTIVTLSDPFFEGRAPGTRGIEHAADYLEWRMTTAGLEPAISAGADAPGGAAGAMTFRQGFEVRGETIVNAADAAWSAGGREVELELGEDWNPMGASATGDVTAPIAFVGYGIEEGEDGYTSFPDDDDLTGKIALVLRFEPMDDNGRSRWADEGWSNNAGLTEKILAPIERGAEAVIFVNAPGADDPRADRLFTTESTTFSTRFDQPVIAMTTDAADALVRAADPAGRSLLALRRLADEGTAGVIDLSAGSVSIDVDLERQRVPTDNIAGVLPGKGALADEWVVLGAHYDHVGYGRYGSRTPNRRGEIHNGADDNASGTAGVLLAAERLKAQYDALPDGAEARSVLFLLFSAEEMGLLGARHFVSEPSIPIESITAMVNMDMIGRVRDDKLQVFGVETADGFRDWLEPRFASSGFDIEASGGGAGPSDHAAFYSEGLPVLHLFSGMHDVYHTPDDDYWTINVEGGVQVANFAADLVFDLAMLPERLTYHQASQETTSTRAAARVRLGVVPGSYDETE
ncbi:MAG: M28 family peptidase, partial [Phycisphaerales bacterium]